MTLLTDLESNELQKYCRVSIVRSLLSIQNYHQRLALVGTNVNMPAARFLEQLMCFEEDRKARYKDRYARHGILVDMMLPSGDWTTTKLRSIAATYAKYVVQKERGLKYIAWQYHKGKSLWIKLFISDREYYEPDHDDFERYASTCYISKKTGAICSQSDPHAALHHARGDIKKDSDGQPIVKKYHFKSTKTRLFAYKKDQRNLVFQRFYDYFRQVLLKVKCKIVKGKFFRRLNLKYAYTRYHKRVITANNQLRQYVQNEINIGINQWVRYPTGYDITRYDYQTGEPILTAECRLYLKLFEKYKKIFAAGYYEYQNMKYLIEDCRCDLAETNIFKLKELFDKELKQLRKGLDSDDCDYNKALIK